MPVPAGFMQQFAAIVDQSRPEQHIGEVLKRFSGDRTPSRILCTGHSMGGALATLGKPTFSLEPSWGCPAFGSYLAQECARSIQCSKKEATLHMAPSTLLLIPVLQVLESDSSLHGAACHVRRLCCWLS